MNNNIVQIESEKTFEIIKSAVDKMANLIKPTFGPAGNNVIISKILSRGEFDDGVQIARDFELMDPAEDAVVKVIREIPIKTDSRVGDGTTQAIIILQAIIGEAAKKPRRNNLEIVNELKVAVKEVSEALKRDAMKIDSLEDLHKVARISFDDEKISKMIAELYHKIGKDGVITVDRSPTLETFVETSDGIKIDNGYISQYMITNPERMEAEIQKPYILITDYRITETNDILPIMEKMNKASKNELIVVCENMEQHALATAVVNKLQGKFNLVAITAPKDKVWLEDFALATGAKVFTESKGDKLESAGISDLGQASKIIVRRTESIVIEPKGDKEKVTNYVAGLRKSHDEEKNEMTKKGLMRQIGMFENSIAVIKVGAHTDSEQKNIKYKVEDAVNSVRQAFQNGVVCGGGLSLARIKTSSSILNEALQAPRNQLYENMGMEVEPIKLIPDRVGAYVTNLVTGKTGDYFEVGVMDPVDVLIAGVESAISISSILLKSTGIIVETPEKPLIKQE